MAADDTAELWTAAEAFGYALTQLKREVARIEMWDSIDVDPLRVRNAANWAHIVLALKGVAL